MSWIDTLKATLGMGWTIGLLVIVMIWAFLWFCVPFVLWAMSNKLSQIQKNTLATANSSKIEAIHTKIVAETLNKQKEDMLVEALDDLEEDTKIINKTNGASYG